MTRNVSMPTDRPRGYPTPKWAPSRTVSLSLALVGFQIRIDADRGWSPPQPPKRLMTPAAQLQREQEFYCEYLKRLGCNCLSPISIAKYRDLCREKGACARSGEVACNNSRPAGSVMTGVWALAALWLGLALIASLLSIWFRISTALSEIVVGTIAQLIIGAAIGS